MLRSSVCCTTESWIDPGGVKVLRCGNGAMTYIFAWRKAISGGDSAMMSVADYEKQQQEMDDDRLPHDPDEFRDFDAENYDKHYCHKSARELTAEIIGCEIREVGR